MCVCEHWCLFNPHKAFGDWVEIFIYPIEYEKRNVSKCFFLRQIEINLIFGKRRIKISALFF